jgi:hypothetical protein
MRYVLMVLVSVLVVAAVDAAVLAGWSGSGSGSSGSGSKDKGHQVQTQQRDVQVGKYVVRLPQSEVEVVKVDAETVIYPYGGNQIISTERIDLLAASGVILPVDVTVGEWDCSYGSNGNSVVYLAHHRKVAGLYVRGSVPDIATLKAVLGTISVSVTPTATPTTKPAK